MVDTTARAFLRSARPAKVLKKDIAAALKKAKVKLAEMKRSDLKPAAEIYQIELKGLG